MHASGGNFYFGAPGTGDLYTRAGSGILDQNVSATLGGGYNTAYPVVYNAGYGLICSFDAATANGQHIGCYEPHNNQVRLSGGSTGRTLIAPGQSLLRDHRRPADPRQSQLRRLPADRGHALRRRALQRQQLIAPIVGGRARASARSVSFFLLRGSPCCHFIDCDGLLLATTI